MPGKQIFILINSFIKILDTSDLITNLTLKGSYSKAEYTSEGICSTIPSQ